LPTSLAGGQRYAIDSDPDWVAFEEVLAVTMPDDVQAYNRQLIEEFRTTGSAPDGRPVLLLTTTGARTGQQRTTPMMYVPDGDRLLVVASNAGAVKHPDWYRNLVANPEVTVEVAGQTYRATAVPLAGEEREKVFADIAGRYTFFADHQAGVERTIPVVALERADT
jgi:deazaflavin-dependent oxidoreductase (nitroreductase family)